MSSVLTLLLSVMVLEKSMYINSLKQIVLHNQRRFWLFILVYWFTQNDRYTNFHLSHFAHTTKADCFLMKGKFSHSHVHCEFVKVLLNSKTLRVNCRYKLFSESLLDKNVFEVCCFCFVFYFSI